MYAKYTKQWISTCLLNKVWNSDSFFILMVDNKLLPKLSQNLLEILDEEYYDITIEVGNDPYDLRYSKKNDETLTNIRLPNILPEI